MKIKRLALIFAVLVLAAALSACMDASITIAGEPLDFLRADISDSFEGIAPAAGNSILTLRFVAKNQNPDLTKISEGFFGETPCTLSDGTNSYPCKSIAFENNGGKLNVLPVFEVPSSLAGSGAKLTLSGNAFSSIQLKI